MSDTDGAHNDFFGTPVKENHHVIVPRDNTLEMCLVEKITPKMIKVRPVKKGSFKSRSYYVYCSQTVIVNSEEALMYILKNQ